MIKTIYKWIRQHYFTIVNSIAFYPLLIAFAFLVLVYLMLLLDASGIGGNIKEAVEWLNMRDSSTARTIIATVAAGIISLVVFSFSMVMLLLNQAAVNMSNRILDNMIGNRFHQVVLGSYVGTVVYAFTLLSTIKDTEAASLIPSLSIYMLILLTILDIFIFIYFLHYITQSVKYETIINRIYEHTLDSLGKDYNSDEEESEDLATRYEDEVLYAEKSGYFQGFAERQLITFCVEHNLKISFSYPVSTYLIKGSELATVSAKKQLNDEERKQLHMLIDITNNQSSIANDPYLGCRQLSEVAIKALSPGINDPGTAILSINRLADLLAFRLSHYPRNVYEDDEGTTRITVLKHSFRQYVADTLAPIWHYGKNDPMVQQAMINVLSQLKQLYKGDDDLNVISKLLNEVKGQTDKEQ